MKYLASTRINDGYTLLELLAYVFVLAVIVNLSTSLFLATRRLHVSGDVSLSRMASLTDFERDFRLATRRADGIVTHLDDFPPENLRLVLHGHDAHGLDEFTVWRQDTSGRVYLETYLSQGDGLTFSGRKVYPAGLTEMSVEQGPHSGLIRVVIHVDNSGTPNTIPAENAFIARLKEVAPN